MGPVQHEQQPTRDEVEAARRLGVGVELYRQFKRNAGSSMDAFERGLGPEDVVAEEHAYRRMREQGGVFKSRGSAPNVFVAAARTPGEVARSLLTIVCYLALLFLLIAVWGEQIQRIHGVIQTAGVLALVVPAMMISSFVWNRIGEGPRDVVRALVRFWPLTFVALVFALGALRVLVG